MLGVAGVRLTLFRFLRVTKTEAEPVTPWAVALMVASPEPLAVAKPVPLLIETVLFAEELHVTLLSTLLDPLPKIPVAVNCWDCSGQTWTG